MAADTGMGKGASMMLTSGASGRINALLSLRAWKSLVTLINALLLVLLLPFRRRMVATTSSGDKNGGGSKVVRVPAALKRKCVDKEVAARRTLAIRRVVQEGQNDNNKETLRDYSLFQTSRGDTLFTRSWTPLLTKVRGLVVILHGLNEHSGRYKYLAKKLNENGFKVYGMDWIGIT